MHVSRNVSERSECTSTCTSKSGDTARIPTNPVGRERLKAFPPLPPAPGWKVVDRSSPTISAVPTQVGRVSTMMVGLGLWPGRSLLI